METNISKRIEIKIQDATKIKSLQRSIDNGEFENKSKFGDCRTELFNYGWNYAANLRDEFNENTDNKIKFDNDYIVAVENRPLMNLQRFKDDEIERLSGIKNLIVDCFGDSKVYKTFSQYDAMLNYLEFLQQPELGEVAGKLNFIDYLHHPDKVALIKVLHDLIDNTKAKNVVTVLFALQEKGFIIIDKSSNAEFYNSMRKEFTFEASNSGLNGFYFKPDKISKIEINSIVNLLD